MKRRYGLAASVAVFCSAAALSPAIRAQEAEEGVVLEVPIAAESQGQAESQTFAFVVEGDDAQPDKAPEYWIGLMGEPVDDALKSQLKIEGGLVLRDVVHDSPAAKAGLKVHDVLLQFGDKQVNDLPTLVETLRGANGAETEAVVFRGGEKVTLKVTPEKRPADQLGVFHEELNVLREHPIGDIIIRGGPDKMRLFAVRPGLVFGGPQAFPKNTSISIHKTDEGPAKIEVKQGDKSWSVTEDKLDELPEEIRASVQQMLSGGRAARVPLPPTPGSPLPPVRLRVEHLQGHGPGPHRVEVERVTGGDDSLSKKLDALIQKIEQLEKEIQSLKDKSGE